MRAALTAWSSLLWTASSSSTIAVRCGTVPYGIAWSSAVRCGTLRCDAVCECGMSVGPHHTLYHSRCKRNVLATKKGRLPVLPANMPGGWYELLALKPYDQIPSLSPTGCVCAARDAACKQHSCLSTCLGAWATHGAGVFRSQDCP
eukprot:357049-Chlamydomonas_euryale.AAC.3